MSNKELSRILFSIAKYLEMEEESFRSVAYRKASRSISSLDRSVEDIYSEGGPEALKEIPGVGESIALKIEEYIKTGKIKYYEELKSKTPIDLSEIIAIEGMGPKKAKILYQKLKVKTISQLEKAAKGHLIAPLRGFGEKTELNILQGIEFLKGQKGRFLLGEVYPIVEDVLRGLRSLREVEKAEVAGSFRRSKETVGDIDLLAVSSEPEKVMEYFASQPDVAKVWGKGLTKSSVRMAEGFDMDLRVVSRKSYGAALQYFTGSKEHNVATRRIAISKGLKLNEYGVFKGTRRIAGETEEDVYKAIGLQWIPPEMRENQGEVELALENKIPRVVDCKDMRGDLHVHSNWDGGNDPIEVLAEVAKKMGYEYIGISDHTQYLKIEHGLDEAQLAKRDLEIDKLNEEYKEFRILKGCEANILNHGEIDIKDEALSKLDYVIAGIHSSMKMGKAEMTERIITAMKNPNVDIFSHPTGRLINTRDEYQIDLEKILRAAKEFNVVLEINASIERLDLKDEYIKRAKKAGVKMVIGTDAHIKEELNLMRLGVAQARRGWAKKKDIINTGSVEELLNNFHD